MNIEEDDTINNLKEILDAKSPELITASRGLVSQIFGPDDVSCSVLNVDTMSMATERAVSHYNNIKTPERASFKPETINSIMHASFVKWKRDFCF
jgi:hypothetical protein